MAKILFFGGKGGVGKTSCSSAFALKRAKEGKKVLLISTDPAHSIADLFNQEIGEEIVEIQKNLYGVEIDAQKESEKYIKSIRRNLKTIMSPIILEEINKQLDAASVSPGSHEAALFDKMIHIINNETSTYDYIVFDTAPTGHTIRLLSLPEILGSWIDSLIKKRKKILNLKDMIKNITRGTKEEDPILSILNKRKNTMEKARQIMIDENNLSFIFVLTAENLPIKETKKAIKLLEKYEIKVNHLVVNRILPKETFSEFWKTKKTQEKKYLTEIERLNMKKIYKIPLFKCDMNESSIHKMSNYF